MAFDITVDQKVNSAMDTAMDSRRAQRAILRGLKEIGHLLKITARAGIRERNKTGRVYNFRGRLHRASAPGEYPAKRTGNLGRSIDFEASGFKMEFGTNISYAKFLQQYKNPEQRSSTWNKVAPRPFLTLAHDSHKNEFVKIMNKHILSEFNL